jgi:hypothetical protein
MGCCATPFEITEIDKVWRSIRPRIPADTPDIDGIRLACLLGEAVCLVAPDAVLVLTVTQGQRGLELFVLLCVGFLPGAFQRREPDLDLIAVDLGACEITFMPRRKGWSRMLGAGWSRCGDAFTREVHHGWKEERAG